MNNSRTVFIDFLRVIASMAVVVLHVLSCFVLNGTGAVSVSALEKIEFFRMYLNWAVPVFFMITGYLFLGIKDSCTYGSIKKYIVKFVVILVTLGYFYALLERIFTEGIGWRVIGLSFVDVFAGRLWAHMWYVYAIIGIYLVLPVLKAFLDASEQNLKILLILMFVWNILLPDVCSLFGVSVGVQIPFGNDLIYVLAGAYIAKLSDELKRKLLPVGCGLVSAVIAVSWIAKVVGDITLNMSYHSLLIFGMAVGVFLIATAGFNCGRGNKLCTHLAPYTWGIYLLHPFFINVLFKVVNVKFDILYRNLWLSIPLTCIGIYLMTCLAVGILKKMPFVKKYI